MRRPPVTCRRAVQSLQFPAPQHIWISDELLSSTFQQFFRSPCPHQKRHGSHVPGPLEARRRAAKRRMTVSTNFYPQDSFPPPFSLGALFGFRKESQPLWRYELPSLPRNAEPLGSQPNVSSLHSQPDPIPHTGLTASTSKPPSYRAAYSCPQNIAQTSVQEQGRAGQSSIGGVQNSSSPLAVFPGQAAGHEAGQASSDVLDFEACFKDFRLRVAHAVKLSAIDRNQLLNRAFQSCRPAQPDAWIYSVMAVKHLMELECNPASVFGETSTFEIPPTYTTQCQELLECLEKMFSWFPHSLGELHRLHIRLAKAASHAETSTSSSQDTELLLLIRHLWQSACSQGVEAEDSIVDLLRTVASKLQDNHCSQVLRSLLSDRNKAILHITRLIVEASKKQAWFLAAEHVLSCIPRERMLAFVPSITLHLVDAIENKTWASKSIYKNRLSTWLKLLHRIATKFASGRSDATFLDLAIAQITRCVIAFQAPIFVGPELLLNALIVKQSQHYAYQSASIKRRSELVDSASTCKLEDRTSVRVEVWLAKLFSQMKSESLPYQDLVGPAIALIVQHADLGLVLRCLTAMNRQNLTLRDASVVGKLIVDKLAMIQQRTDPLTEIQIQHDAFALRTCQRIFEVLNSIISPSAVRSLAVQNHAFSKLHVQRQFRHILDRARADHALPPAYQNLTIDIPPQQQVDLIHQVAHQYSLDATRSQKEIWRAVYYLYHHLIEHSLPIGPLFTKSVVRVSIIRPLSENRFVSVRRLIWVCQLVARVEGEEVARRIESDFWYWRGNLIQHAKTVFVGLGGNPMEKAHLGTMKKLNLI